MHVDTSRRIDYYVGIPLCFLATCALRLARWVKRPPLTAPANVLLIELSEMGSAILLDPAMEKLKRHGADLYFLIFKRNEPSLRLLNTISHENAFTLDDSSLWSLARTTLQFLRWTRARQIDCVIDCELFSRFTALLAGLSGARHRVGFYKFTNEGLYRGEMLTKKVAFNPHIHIARNFLSLVHAVYADDREWPFAKIAVETRELVLKKATVSPTVMASANEKLLNSAGEVAGKRVVLVNANSSNLLPQRHWGAENFRALIEMLLGYRNDILVLLTGVQSERMELERLRCRVNSERCLNVAGVLEFHELPALYALSTCMVTNDSGPAHFAAVTSLPTYVLFGPETPDLYGPLGSAIPIYARFHCSPCVSAWNHRKSPCQDNKCLQVITPEAVFEMVKPALSHS